MPSDLSTYSIVSARAVKIFSANLNPKGSIASMYTAPFHCTPSKCLPFGWTGTIWYANLMYTFASMVPCPNFAAWQAMVSMYDTEQCLDEISSFTLAPFGLDRSVISLRPLELAFGVTSNELQCMESGRDSGENSPIKQLSWSSSCMYLLMMSECSIADAEFDVQECSLRFWLKPILKPVLIPDGI